MQRKTPQLFAKYHFWKKQEKLPKSPKKCAIWKKTGIFGVFSWFFQKRYFAKSCGLLRCIQCIKTLILSYQNQQSDNFFDFSPSGGTLDIWGGQKVTRSGKKRLKKFLKKNLKGCTKWNTKIGGRSFDITCGAFGHGLLFCGIGSFIKCILLCFFCVLTWQCFIGAIQVFHIKVDVPVTFHSKFFQFAKLWLAFEVKFWVWIIEIDSPPCLHVAQDCKIWTFFQEQEKSWHAQVHWFCGGIGENHHLQFCQGVGREHIQKVLGAGER